MLVVTPDASITFVSDTNADVSWNVFILVSDYSEIE